MESAEVSDNEMQSSIDRLFISDALHYLKFPTLPRSIDLFLAKAPHMLEILETTRTKTSRDRFQIGVSEHTRAYM